MRTIAEQHGSMAAWAPMSAEPEPWRAAAACNKGLSASEIDRIFFPFAERERRRDRSVMYDEARVYCEGCTVRQECLDEAVALREISFGFRGGMAPWERRQQITTGTTSHRCPVCAVTFIGRHDAKFCGLDCRREGHRLAQRESAKRRREVTPGELWEGETEAIVQGLRGVLVTLRTRETIDEAVSL